MAAEETQKDNSVVGLRKKTVVVVVVLGLSPVGKEKAAEEVETVAAAEEVETVAAAEEVEMVAAAMERMEKKEKGEILVMEGIEAEEANGYGSTEENLVRKILRN